MLEKLKQISSNLKSIDVNKLIDDVFNELMPEILDLNLDQLSKGQLNDGELLESYRSASYYEFKRSLGSYKAPNAAADLFVEGNFYRGFRGEVKTDIIEIDSTDSKASGLESKYSSDIYGLQPKNIDYIRKEIIPILQQEIRKQFKI